MSACRCVMASDLIATSSEVVAYAYPDCSQHGLRTSNEVGGLVIGGWLAWLHGWASTWERHTGVVLVPPTNASSPEGGPNA